jgi:DNA-binding PadR family transcriptional regulator
MSFDDMSMSEVSSRAKSTMTRRAADAAVEPLTEATFCILLSLASAAKHGYAILKDVERLSGGRVRLSTGTLYGAIKRLLEQGWIARIEREAGQPAGRAGATYGLTDLGKRVLAAETARLDGLLAVARARLAGGNA